MRRMAASQVRREFSETLKKACRGERILLSHHGKDVAAMVPVEDLALLEELQDRFDARAGVEALDEIEREGTVSWDQLKAELDL
jgi:prevent-host-death family protein